MQDMEKEPNSEKDNEESKYDGGLDSAADTSKENGQDYEFNEKNMYDLDSEQDFYLVVSLSTGEPSQSFGPFESQDDAQEWIENNEDKFEDELIIVPCVSVETNEEEEEGEEEEGEEEEGEEEEGEEEGENQEPTEHQELETEELIIDSKSKNKNKKNKNKRGA